MEAFFTLAHLGIGISKIPVSDVRVSTAPGGEVGTFYAGGLDEACDGERLRSSMFEGLSSEPSLD